MCLFSDLAWDTIDRYKLIHLHVHWFSMFLQGHCVIVRKPASSQWNGECPLPGTPHTLHRLASSLIPHVLLWFLMSCHLNLPQAHKHPCWISDNRFTFFALFISFSLSLSVPTAAVPADNVKCWSKGLKSDPASCAGFYVCVALPNGSFAKARGSCPSPYAFDYPSQSCVNVWGRCGWVIFPWLYTSSSS